MIRIVAQDRHREPRRGVAIYQFLMDYYNTKILRTVMSPAGLPRSLRSLAITARAWQLAMATVAGCKKYVLLVRMLLIILLLQGGCLFYSLSGSSLSKEAKTFTIQEFQSKVALGPANLAEQITQQLREEITQKTSLKETVSNGDIQFDGVITAFKYTPIAPRSTSDGATASRTQLSITVQVNYTNIYDKDFEFSKKDFTQTTDVEAGNENTQEATMVGEVVKKLIQDIFNASIANW